ncbi:Protein CBG12398 [Caenorhabditis briggsae]|uniref:Uncharacterized protein n=2 Tax=Caenorhabditis briggsae TaxID=6238 RepID=A0AAE9IZW1_CAEBR|nr:Protein CBG12398 [Caenorhabditis briggsae]ULU12310.1 hypothetical protein L3Y34_015555 [Caenorhabditis briggsae]UMM13261.1 hypothetical protein L5515_001632 [Caenorhabditis briggsae]CAP31383.2 Protein CBG12398 [Caenorhabditis briggsae]
MSVAPLKLPAENGKRRDSTSSIGASTYTGQENPRSEEKFLTVLSQVEQPSRELTIVTMSHAESMGLIFPNWVRICYRRGPMEYQPYDMNMPPKLIPRQPLHYKFDSPLTERGQIVAETYGRGLTSIGVRPYEIFCSPDMKSVQTAAALVKGLGLSFSAINIEPALMGYRQMLPPNYHEMILSPKTYFGMGYPINNQYEPIQGFFPSENIEDYNLRIRSFYKEKIAKIEQKYVVVVADNVVVDMTQNIRFETVDDILRSTKKPTCQMSFISLKQGDAHILDSPVLPLTKSLYVVKPFYWSEVPLKLAVPNHPELNQN